MKGLWITLISLQLAFAQRVVPGVNPQHYQQVPVQQQYQQPQYQQQQPHLAPGVNPQQYQHQQQPPQQVQYQQAPQQVPQQVHQVPQGHPQQQQQQQQQPQHVQQQQQQQHQPQQHQQPPHVHSQNGQPQQVLHAGNMDQERAHIQEHMQVPIDTSKMSEAELQFHYFKMHDSDNNNKLDGCELIKSLIHWHAEDKTATKKNEKNAEGGTGEKEGTIYTDQGLSDVIDYVLKTMDFNNDGFVDYMEYRKSEEAQAADKKKTD